LLHSAYGDYQLRPFKNLHQLVEDTLVVVRSRLKVVFQYALCFADRLERQLLISHRLSPITQNKTELQTREGCADKQRGKIKPLFGLSHQILLLCGQPHAIRCGREEGE
jgi:hypothetical protein